MAYSSAMPSMSTKSRAESVAVAADGFGVTLLARRHCEQSTGSVMMKGGRAQTSQTRYQPMVGCSFPGASERIRDTRFCGTG